MLRLGVAGCAAGAPDVCLVELVLPNSGSTFSTGTSISGNRTIEIKGDRHRKGCIVVNDSERARNRCHVQRAIACCSESGTDIPQKQPK
jgi:hypothetical protein